jgi:hypothetical protein
MFEDRKTKALMVGALHDTIFPGTLTREQIIQVADTIFNQLRGTHWWGFTHNMRVHTRAMYLLTLYAFAHKHKGGHNVVISDYFRAAQSLAKDKEDLFLFAALAKEFEGKDAQ